MGDEQEEALMAGWIFGLLLSEKTPKKPKTTILKKSWRQRECGLYALQHELEVSKNGLLQRAWRAALCARC